MLNSATAKLPNMTWNRFINTVKVRAIEEADGQDRIWDAETRRTTTQVAQSRAGKQVGAFLPYRAGMLLGQMKETTLAGRLTLPVVPGWFALVWIGAFLMGWWLAALGQEQEINLLALPLIGVLLWNFAVMSWSLVTSFGKPHAPVWLGRMLERWAPKDADAASDPLLAAARLKFHHLAWAPSLQRLACLMHAWLHIGAAVLALGSIVGMYAHGWSKEYRAVWESTLLNEESAAKFLGTLFTPASQVTGIAIPLDQLSAMHRRSDQPAPLSGEALPWIHLYAATLGMLVILPRLLLAGWDLARARSIANVTVSGPEWRGYYQRLLSFTDGNGSAALVLTHGLSADPVAQDRWRQVAHRLWPDVGALAFHNVPVGGEPEFVTTWEPGADRILMIFSMASTPEAEVHRSLVEGLLKKDGRSEGALSCTLYLDDLEIRKRWSGFADADKRLADRTNSWKQTMDGLPVSWV